MKERNFVKSASLLAFSTIIAKFIGACYRIPLANILGGEGMGLYQLVFPVFALLITLSSGAVPSAVAIIVSRKKALNQNSGGAFISSLILITTWGFLLSLLLIILSKHISVLQSTSKIQKSYVMIAPSVFFVSVISVYRGYFIGNQKMTPPAVNGQITEAIIKLTAGLALAKKFLKMGLEYAVMAAFLGITVSEIITLIILFILSDNKKSINSGISFAEFKANTKEIASLTFPLMAGGIIIPLSLFFDSLIIINMLNLNQSSVMSTIEYGLFSERFHLINLPVMLNLSLGVAVAPLAYGGQNLQRHSIDKRKMFHLLKNRFGGGDAFFVLFVFGGRFIETAIRRCPRAHKNGGRLNEIESLNIISCRWGK